MITDNNTGYIYIVLVKALTGLGKLVRSFGGYEYTHIAVCMDEKLEDFITFSRKKHYAPFDSGFMHETMDCYAFGDNSEVKLKVFRVPVSDSAKGEIAEYIRQTQEDEEYVFNILSMVTMPLLHGFLIYKAHNCMSFTARIIEMTGSVKMERPYYKYSIKAMDELLTDYLYNEGYYRKTKTEKPDYMDRVGIVHNAGAFFKVVGTLIGRIIRRV